MQIMRHWNRGFGIPAGVMHSSKLRGSNSPMGGVWFDRDGPVWRRGRKVGRVSWDDIHGIRLIEETRGSGTMGTDVYLLELHVRGAHQNVIIKLPTWYRSTHAARRDGIEAIQRRSPTTLDVWDSVPEPRKNLEQKRQR